MKAKLAARSGCVVIPFFQKQEGVLARALRSAFNQSAQDFNIIVVDDGSTVRATSEIKNLEPSWQSRIRVIEQQNGGAGAARNTGLNALPPDAAYVAFLDSDDEWFPDHLERARHAILELGAECFCGSLAEDPAFSHSKNFVHNKDLGTNQITDTTYSLDSLKSALLTNWGEYFHLSGLVIAPRIFAAVRFDTSLRFASEDLMFFFQCSLRNPMTVISTKPSVVRGFGDNMHHGTEWGSAKALRQIRDEFCVWNTIAKQSNFKTAVDEERLSLRLNEYRLKAMWCAREGFSRRNPGILNEILVLVARNPSLIYSFIARK